MARCGCSDTCSCLVVQGDGIIVDGNGTVQNPYRVTADPDNVSEDVVFSDSGTIAWDVTGVGSGDQAMVVSANAQVSMRELTDVLASDVPVTGDVVTWQTDHWEFMPTPAGTPLKGGTTGQMLTKKSNTDYDFQWTTPPVGTTRKYAAALAGTSSSPETVTHNLGTLDVLVGVWNSNSPYQMVEVDWNVATINTITVSYSPILGSGYRVVVIG